MGLRDAVIALFDGPDTARTPPAAPPAPPAPASAPLLELLTAYGARLATIEASLDGLRGYVKGEVERGERTAEAGRRAVQRALRRMGDIEDESNASDDVSGDDDGARQPRGVLPLRQPMEEPAPAPATAEEIRAYARRQAALGG